VATATEDPWQGSEAYERFMGRWSAAICHPFVERLAAPPGLRWADLGCGTGALTRAVLALAEPTEVTGIEPSPAFRAFARRAIDDPRAHVVAGDAATLPLARDGVDVLVSAFVLNFVPDPEIALRAASNVVAPGGTVAMMVWDYRDGMAFLRRFWDAAVERDPAAADLDEGRRFPLCRPEPLRALFSAAGLDSVTVEAIEITTRFADFDDYWQPFLGGTGPAPGYLASRSDDQREALRSLLERRLTPEPDGTIPLTARAWAAVGRVPTG
jgi:SAM-dependent methyltransferase